MPVAFVRCAVEDPVVAEEYGLQWETFETADEAYFLDGPVAPRVAIVDRNPRTTRLEPPVKWSEAGKSFVVPADDRSSPAAIAVSVFGTVLETLQLFERDDVLGHPLRWAFDSPQLLVVPQAGDWANAFYDRYSRSLQFFSFGGEGGRPRVHTALSRDIVAHETGHAILDALAPALYDSLTPETLALHEAIGDLTAIVMALRSPGLRRWLIQSRGGRLAGDSPIPALATQFGEALGRKSALRNADNDKRRDEVDEEPHALSEVLTGAMWRAIVAIHDKVLEDRSEHGDDPEKACSIAAGRVARILFRALDYVPPAEATFADYIRSVITADAVVYPNDRTGYRDILKQQCVDRRIVANAKEVEPVQHHELLDIDFDDVLESDWAAYQFANEHRKLLCIPERIPFRIFPRREVKRDYYFGPNDKRRRREMIFQLTWEKHEDNEGIAGVPSRRAVFQGTTLVIGGEGGSGYPVLSCLTSDGSRAQAQKRSDLVRGLAANNSLAIANTWTTLRSRPLAEIVFARASGDLLRLRGTARLLHIRPQDGAAVVLAPRPRSSGPEPERSAERRSFLSRVLGITRIVGIVAVLLAAGATVISGTLALTGTPASCSSTPVSFSDQAGRDLESAWNRTFSGPSARPVSITVTDSQVTSRGVRYLDEEDVPIHDLQVHFCAPTAGETNGHAEASGKVSVLGRDVNVVARGTLDLSGETLKLQIDSLEAGNLPSWVAKPATDLIANGDYRTLHLKASLTSIAYRDGSAVIEGNGVR